MNHRVARPGRRRQQGQMIPILALSAIVLLGFAALAVDLSLQTHDQRTLQNVSDAAALSGAEDLTASPAASDQYQGAQDALQIIRKRMGWSTLKVGGGTVTNTVWATSLAAPCSPASNTGSPPACNITKTVCSNAVPAPSDLPASCDSYTSLGANAHYFSITIQTPAVTSNVASHTDPHFFEVTMAQDTQNYLAGVIGKGVSTQASRSTAYHFPGNQAFGFALFAKTIVQTQNKSTLIVGDVYADRNIDPQSSGQAGMCIAGGLVILGSPQDNSPAGATPSDGQAEVLPNTAHPIHYDTSGDCSASPLVNTTNKGSVNQTRNPQAGCTVAGAAFTASYDAGIGNDIQTCVATPPLTAPSLPAPTITNPNSTFTCVTATAAGISPGKYSCNGNNQSALTISSSSANLSRGLYFISHNPQCTAKNCYDVDISANVSLSGVTFWLDSGATLGVHGTGTTVKIDPAPPLVTTSPGDGRYPIYAPPGSAANVWVDNNGASLQMDGTLYIPDGTAHTSSNAFFQIDGQAIVGEWDDQGGNHNTADISYNAGRNAPQAEILKLVE